MSLFTEINFKLDLIEKEKLTLDEEKKALELEKEDIYLKLDIIEKEKLNLDKERKALELKKVEIPVQPWWGR